MGNKGSSSGRRPAGLDQLTDMGFPEPICVDALRRYNGNVEQAAQALVEGGGTLPPLPQAQGVPVQTRAPAPHAFGHQLAAGRQMAADRAAQRAAQAPSSSVSDASLDQLLAMGFDRSLARQALQRNSGDVPRAVAELSPMATSAAPTVVDLTAAPQARSQAPPPAASSQDAVEQLAAMGFDRSLARQALQGSGGDVMQAVQQLSAFAAEAPAPAPAPAPRASAAPAAAAAPSGGREERLKACTALLASQPLVLELLEGMIQQLQSHPFEPKFRTLHLANRAFAAKVADAPAALDFLRALGYADDVTIESKPILVLRPRQEDPGLLWMAKSLLQVGHGSLAHPPPPSAAAVHRALKCTSDPPSAGGEGRARVPAAEGVHRPPTGECIECVECVECVDRRAAPRAAPRAVPCCRNNQHLFPGRH